MTDFFLLTPDRLTSPECSRNSQTYPCWTPLSSLAYLEKKENITKSEICLMENLRSRVSSCKTWNSALQCHCLWHQPKWGKGTAFWLQCEWCSFGAFPEGQAGGSRKPAGLKLFRDLGLEAKRYSVLFQHVIWIGSTVTTQPNFTLQKSSQEPILATPCISAHFCAA